ncbi:MAG: hypothetical protein KBF12_08155 [Sebaldella sp.]|nr:hypothetical protein [Sebaldella sp.]
MKKLLLGTTNKSKIITVKSASEGLEFEFLNLKDFGIENYDVEETGKSEKENAVIKAVEYYRISKTPVLSIDTGLYLEGLSEEKQPGVFVRRMVSEKATDREMTDYYKKMIKSLGGSVIGKWKIAYCFVKSENEKLIYEVETSRTFVEKESKIYTEGYPLASIQIDNELNKYVSEITNKEKRDLDNSYSKEVRKILENIYLNLNS